MSESEPVPSSAPRKGARGGKITATPAQAIKSAARGGRGGGRGRGRGRGGSENGRGGRGRGGGRGGFRPPRADGDAPADGEPRTETVLEKVDEPDEAAFKADTDDIQRKIEAIEQHTTQCRQSIDQLTADRERYREELKQLASQRLTAIQNYNVYIEECNQYKSSITNLKLQEINVNNRLAQVKTELGPYTDLSALDTRIAQLEYSLNTKLPVAQQSKVIEEIRELKLKRPVVLQYQKDLLASKSSSFDPKPLGIQRDAADKKAKAAQAERDKIDHKMDEIRQSDQSAAKEINRLIKLRREEQKPLRSLLTQLERKQKDFDRQVKAYDKYEEQQERLRIKENRQKERERERQEYLKRKARREERQAQYEARKAEREAEWARQEEEETSAAAFPADPLAQEKQICEDLIRYLVKIGHIKEQEIKQEQEKEHKEQKERNSDFKGKKVAEFKKKEEDVFGPLEPKKKKGQKAPQAAASTTSDAESHAKKARPINHIPDILAMFQAIKIEVPIYPTDVTTALTSVKEKLEEYHRQTEEAASKAIADFLAAANDGEETTEATEETTDEATEETTEEEVTAEPEPESEATAEPEPVPQEQKGKKGKKSRKDSEDTKDAAAEIITTKESLKHATTGKSEAELEEERVAEAARIAEIEHAKQSLKHATTGKTPEQLAKEAAEAEEARKKQEEEDAKKTLLKKRVDYFETEAEKQSPQKHQVDKKPAPGPSDKATAASSSSTADDEADAAEREAAKKKAGAELDAEKARRVAEAEAEAKKAAEEQAAAKAEAQKIAAAAAEAERQRRLNEEKQAKEADEQERKQRQEAAAAAADAERERRLNEEKQAKEEEEKERKQRQTAAAAAAEAEKASRIADEEANTKLEQEERVVRKRTASAAADEEQARRVSEHNTPVSSKPTSPSSSTRTVDPMEEERRRRKAAFEATADDEETTTVTTETPTTTTTSGCSHCGKQMDTPKACSACKSVSYCDQNCQKSDWKTHKIICKQITGAAAK